MSSGTNNVELIRTIHDIQTETATTLGPTGQQNRVVVMHLVTENNLCDPATRRIDSVVLTKLQLAVLVATLIEHFAELPSEGDEG